MSRNMSSFTQDMETNYYGYYIKTAAHNIAVSGANMAASVLFFNKGWTNGFGQDNAKSLNGGFFWVKIDTINTYDRRLTCTSLYQGSRDTVIIMLTPQNFAQYGNFYASFGGVYAATGDTFSGPFHVNDKLNISGTPVFLGRTTSRLGLNPTNAKPKLLGGYESGVNIPLDFDTSSIRIAAYSGGKIFKDTTGAKRQTDVDLQFNSDGSVTYKININNAGWSSAITKPLSTLAPNGVICAEKGNIYVKGVVNGRATIVATKYNSTSTSLGNIYITSDIKYNTNPVTNPESTDMLGMCAEESVTLTFVSTRGDIDIQASMFSKNKGLVIQSYDSYPSAHSMRVFGGVIANTVQATATYDYYGNPIRGYSFVHKFDERFMKIVPPYFPQTRFYKILSWYE
jgi:hypothetical protein